MSNKSTDDSTVVFVSPEAAVKIERLIAEASETASKLSSLQSLVREYLAAQEACDDVMESYDYEAEPPVTKEEYQQAEAVVEEKLQALRAAVPN